eukprot:XP_017452368.1 PREDICTED: uncharacterized protein LOC102552880 isoform X3 [Rattus norvegicus]
MTSFSRYTPEFREVGSQRTGAGREPGNRGAGSRRARRARAGRSEPRTAPRARSRAAAQRGARAASTMHRCAGGRRANPTQLILGPRASLAIHRRRSRALLPLPPEQEGRKGKPDRKGAGCQFSLCSALPAYKKCSRDNVRKPEISVLLATAADSGTGHTSTPVCSTPVARVVRVLILEVAGSHAELHFPLVPPLWPFRGKFCFNPVTYSTNAWRLPATHERPARRHESGRSGCKLSAALSACHHTSPL